MPRWRGRYGWGNRARFAVLAVALAVGAPKAGMAQEMVQEGRWAIGLTGGSYAPKLRQLNAVLAQPGQVILQDPNFLIPRNQDLPVVIRDVGTPGLTSAASYGIEAVWEWQPRVSFVFSALNWQGRSSMEDTITMSLRSNLPPIDVPRSARYNLNLNQLWVGWRYSFFDRPREARLFANINIAGLAVADWSMDTLLKVQQEPGSLIPSFASISSAEFHGTAYSSRYGLGGEVFISENISLGFQSNYILSTLNKLRMTRFFPAGFAELPPLPPTPVSVGGVIDPPNLVPTVHALPEGPEQLTTATVTEPREAKEVVSNPTPVDLDLNGWEFAFTFRIYY